MMLKGWFWMTSNLVGVEFYQPNNASEVQIFPLSSSVRANLHRTSDKVQQTGTSFSPRDCGTAMDRTANFDKQDVQEETSYKEVIIASTATYEQKLRKAIIVRLVNEISYVIQNDEFVDGEVSSSEAFMQDLYSKNQLDYIADALMELYSKNLSTPHMLEGILLMVSSVPFETIAPKGQIMAMGLLSHKNLSVRDRAIQCFERWNSRKGLDYLKNLDCHPQWLQKYVEKVIMYIERDGID